MTPAERNLHDITRAFCTRPPSLTRIRCPACEGAGWVVGSSYAALCVPTYARLLPMTASAMPTTGEQVFAARTMREAWQ